MASQRVLSLSTFFEQIHSSCVLLDYESAALQSMVGPRRIAVLAVTLNESFQLPHRGGNTKTFGQHNENGAQNAKSYLTDMQNKRKRKRFFEVVSQCLQCEDNCRFVSAKSPRQ